MSALSIDLAKDLNLDRPMIVHGDRRWDSEWKRPQHLVSRFARSRDVLYIDTPLFVDDQPYPVLAHAEPMARVQHVVPTLPLVFHESDAATQSVVRALILELLGRGGRLYNRFSHPVQWFYTPTPAPTMLSAFGEVAVVYDYMETPAPSILTSEEIAARTQFLLAHADVVFDHGVTSASRYARAHNTIPVAAAGLPSESPTSWESVVDGISVLMHRAIAKRARRKWHEQMHGIRL